MNQEDLKAILLDNKHSWNNHGYVEIVVSKIEGGLEIEFTDMYDAPTLEFARLKKLGEFFGTEKIDVDGAPGYGGCDTCDWGSKHGHTIRVLEPTKNVPESFPVEVMKR